MTPAVKRGDPKPPTCEHGEWTFAGTDYKRQSDEMALPHRRVQAEVHLGHGGPTAPAHPATHGALGEAVTRAVAPSNGRSGGPSTNGRCCAAGAGRDRVALHADLTILAELGCALAKTGCWRSPDPAGLPANGRRPRSG
jgi:hypothetical protein